MKSLSADIGGKDVNYPWVSLKRLGFCRRQILVGVPAGVRGSQNAREVTPDSETASHLLVLWSGRQNLNCDDLTPSQRWAVPTRPSTALNLADVHKSSQVISPNEFRAACDNAVTTWRPRTRQQDTWSIWNSRSGVPSLAFRASVFGRHGDTCRRCST